MESDITINQDSSGKTIVREKPKPKGWGETGYGFQSAYLIAWLFSICFKRKKTVFDEKDQTLKFKNKIISFSNIKKVEVIVCGEIFYSDFDGNSGYLSICDLELLLNNDNRLHLGRSWLTEKTRDIAQKIATITQKPLTWPEEAE